MGIVVPRLAIVTTAYVVITVIAAAANAFSGIAALAHFAPIRQGMVQVGVPRSWLRFPIGTLKTAGAAGLIAGLAGVPYVGTAAAIGPVLFFVCAVYTHVLADDYSPQFGLALGLLMSVVELSTTGRVTDTEGNATWGPVLRQTGFAVAAALLAWAAVAWSRRGGSVRARGA